MRIAENIYETATKGGGSLKARLSHQAWVKANRPRYYVMTSREGGFSCRAMLPSEVIKKLGAERRRLTELKDHTFSRRKRLEALSKGSDDCRSPAILRLKSQLKGIKF